jgi:hypothetical protein
VVRTQERAEFLHRCLPHPAQCDTPGTEVEARVTEEQLLRTQDELVISGPGGGEVMVPHRVYLVNTYGVKELLEGPFCSLPEPV